jgi:hypothetical protein
MPACTQIAWLLASACGVWEGLKAHARTESQVSGQHASMRVKAASPPVIVPSDRSYPSWADLPIRADAATTAHVAPALRGVKVAW